MKRDTATPAEAGETSQTVDGPSTQSMFSSLPTELLECVADYLTGAELGSLRKTCREISEKIDYAYTSKCFTDRCFLLSNECSLAILYRISGHEKYSKSIRHLRFCPAMIEPLPYHSYPVEDRAERRHRRDQKRLHHRIWSRQLILYDDEFLASCLCAILMRFKNAGNFPKLGLSLPSDKDFKSPWGWEALQAITKMKQPARQDCAANHMALFIALLASQYETEELQIGRKQHELPMPMFKGNGLNFPATKLRRLELWLSLSGDHYDEELEYVNCPLRREDLQDFMKFVAQAQSLEHLFLHLSPIMEFSDAFEDYGQPNQSRLRADVFQGLVTKSYLDGTSIEVESNTMLLPKLKSIDLGYHQIELSNLLRFCTERMSTLEQVRLSRIVDLDADTKHPRDNVVQQILAAIGGDSKTDPIVDVSKTCYSGDGWFDLYRWYND